MRLCEFIQANRDEIIRAWEAEARQQPAAAHLDRPALIDHVPRLLEDFSEVMMARAEPDSREAAPADEHADDHAYQRLEQGFLLSHVVRELSLLRTCILRLWREAFPQVSVDDAERLAALVDRAIERSVDRFIQYRSRALEDALREARRTAEFRELFLGIVSHDLRNPMNAIAMSAGLLLKSPALPPQLARPAGRILANVERMARMVSDLLDFTRGRLGGGIPIVRTAMVDLKQLTRRVVDEAELASPSRQLTCDFRGDTVGTWDPDRLMQLIGNLIGNAIRHGASDHPVRVKLDGAGDEVIWSVHNAGPPIPAESLPFLFEPFCRGEDPTAARDGLGLGLFIASEIARAHGGRLSVSSDEAHGTTFELRLPRQNGAAPRKTEGS